MSHQTHYRSYWGRVLRVKWPNQQCRSTGGSKDQASIPSGPPHHAHKNTTAMQYETKTHKIHTDKSK